LVLCASTASALRRRLLHAPPELRGFAFAGLHRDGGLTGVGSDRVTVRVAEAMVRQLRRADNRLRGKRLTRPRRLGCRLYRRSARTADAGGMAEAIVGLDGRRQLNATTRSRRRRLQDVCTEAVAVAGRLVAVASTGVSVTSRGSRHERVNAMEVVSLDGRIAAVVRHERTATCLSSSPDRTVVAAPPNDRPVMSEPSTIRRQSWMFSMAVVN
jgi:hypothetical protein